VGGWAYTRSHQLGVGATGKTFPSKTPTNHGSRCSTEPVDKPQSSGSQIHKRTPLFDARFSEGVGVQ